MRAALYLRRSTNEYLQRDSLDVQEEILRRYAEQNDHEIVEVFKDSASGTSVAGRKGFESLITVVKHGAPFDLILVRDVSRWGRFPNLDEAAYWQFICQINGVAVVYTEEPFEEDGSPYSALLKAMKRCLAAEFSRERSRLVRPARRRLAELGFHVSGLAPYGLKRVITTPDGAFLRDLPKGERKPLANTRIKLAPGDPSDVATVRRIFKMFAEEHFSVPAIAATLNRAGTPSPRNREWSAGTIYNLLHNEAFIGTLVFRTDSRPRADHEENSSTVRIRRSFAAIVDEETWVAAQQRLSPRQRRKTDSQLVAVMRQASRTWPQNAAENVLALCETTDGAAALVDAWRRGYPLDIEEEVAIASARAIDALTKRLQHSFTVTKFRDGIILDDLLFVGFKSALPRAYRCGLHWEFPFDGTEDYDVVIGLGLSSSPDLAHVETFVVRCLPKRRRAHVCRANLLMRSKENFFRESRRDNLLAHLRHCIYFRSKAAERLFLAAASKQTLLNLAQLSRELGWKFSTTLMMHKRLTARGLLIPPRKKIRGRRIEIVCSECGCSRFFVPSQALLRKTDKCFECLYKKPTHKFAVTCPDCRTTRRVFRHELNRLQNGAESLCSSCALKRGRMARHRSSRRVLR